MNRAKLMSRLLGRGAFTLVELMIVVVIVAILAMVAIPMYRGSVKDAKMAEGIAGVGAIHSAARVYIATRGALPDGATLTTLGFAAGDLNGKYFNQADYTFTNTSGTEYTITVGPSTKDTSIDYTYTINQDGVESGTFTTE